MSDDDDDDDRGLLRPPVVAWWTLLLALVCAATIIALIVGIYVGVVSPIVAVVVGSVACFAGFTPVHEASHRSASRIAVVNEATGHLCSTLLTGAFTPYRWLHLEHHKHTNDVDQDPDHWSGRGPSWLLPLRWVTQDVGYLAFYGRRWRDRPSAERANLAIATAGYAGVFVGSFAVDRDLFVGLVAGWFVPARVALFALACTFDWLPHAPHIVTAAVDRHRATVVRSASVWTWLLLGQNHHLVHHLYPAVPFHRLARVWRARKQELLAHGAVDKSA